MKKAISIVGLSIIIALPAFAQSMCAKNSVVTVVLDPNIAPSNYTYNNASGVWKATASYGTITGISTCIADAPQGSRGTLYNSDGEYVEAIGGQTTGGNCWCKMVHPMESLWVFDAPRGLDGCVSACVEYCGMYIIRSFDFRNSIFGSVQQ